MLDPLRLTRLCVLVLGAGLLLDGALLLALNAVGAPAAFGVADLRQNVLHVVSGVILLGVSFGSEVRAMWAALLLGAFYVALGVLGLTIEQPFGLQLGPGENAFHFGVGVLAFVLGAWALRTSSLAPAPLRSGAPLPATRSAPAARRAARRRPGKARRNQRRR